MNEYNISSLNESCLLIRLEREDCEESVRILLSLFYALKDSEILRALGVIDLVPAYRVVAVHFSGQESNSEKIERRLRLLISDWSPKPFTGGSTYRLSVQYDGPDLLRVADGSGLSVHEVILRHTKPLYVIAMIGFKPHFPYLLGLDPALEMPRLENPRSSVPAGSVGIGGNQTGVYPESSPGGWNLIGRTDPLVLTRLQPGDQVQFIDAGVTCS